MTKAEKVFLIILPVLAVSIASILLCFYLLFKKKRGQPDASMPMQVRAVSSSEDQVDEGPFPPRHSTVDQPPPYSLFDPKLTNVWPGGLPTPYEVYPVMLHLPPHWTTDPLQPDRPSSAGQTHLRP